MCFARANTLQLRCSARHQMPLPYICPYPRPSELVQIRTEFLSFGFLNDAQEISKRTRTLQSVGVSVTRARTLLATARHRVVTQLLDGVNDIAIARKKFPPNAPIASNEPN